MSIRTSPATVLVHVNIPAEVFLRLRALDEAEALQRLKSPNKTQRGSSAVGLLSHQNVELLSFWCSKGFLQTRRHNHNQPHTTTTRAVKPFAGPPFDPPDGSSLVRLGRFEGTWPKKRNGTKPLGRVVWAGSNRVPLSVWWGDGRGAVDRGGARVPEIAFQGHAVDRVNPEQPGRVEPAQTSNRGGRVGRSTFIHAPSGPPESISLFIE